MLHRVPPVTYPRISSSKKDWKGSFTTRTTGKVPGNKNCDKRAYYLQQPACWNITSKAVVRVFSYALVAFLYFDICHRDPAGRGII